jgi:rare lipoprotein A
MHPVRNSVAAAAALILAGCSVAPSQPEPSAPPVATPSAPPAVPTRGAYYKDDGPGDNPPADLAAIPDAVPRTEPPHRFANRPYRIEGREYTPLASVMTSSGPFRQTGMGSWYGRRFHGNPTSSGERYDMYAMTAAHPTLPIPSYARVTNLANGRSVVVRINDRGPFHADRIIDLSYTAAWKLGYVEAGSARVQVESIVSGIETATTVRAIAPVAAQGTAPAAKGIFLQLGAYGSRAAADEQRARAARELAWLTQDIGVVAMDNLHRVQAGPFSSQDEARAVADRIQSELRLKPVLVVR